MTPKELAAANGSPIDGDSEDSGLTVAPDEHAAGSVVERRADPPA
jgi:hypothetical protein